MSDHDDFAFEPIKGLPERLPAGEEILWQGKPNWMALARESLLLNWVIGYFLLLALWRFGVTYDTLPLDRAIHGTVPFLVLGLLAAGLIMLIAWIQARVTVYTITNARVVLRIGAALTLSLNLPFTKIEAASLDQRKRGTGTIALQTTDKTKISYLVLWPHMRPWKMNPAQPALRCIDDAQSVARLLADAADARLSQPQIERQPLGDAVAAE